MFPFVPPAPVFHFPTLPLMVMASELLAQSQPVALTAVPTVPLPSDANVANVRDYGAKGDGVTDDTAAIQQAMNTNRFVYLPQGIYLVSATLQTRPKKMVLQGESQTRTVIRLKNNTVGFTNPAAPKPLITTFEGGSTGQAFQNLINNLTVDIGAGNVGAIGIRLTNNNQGGIRDVTIRSSDPERQGRTGLALTQQWPGPGLVKHVAIEGFDYGIRVANPEYSYVFEDLTLQNQRIAGIDNNANILSIRKLSSINIVPAIQNSGDDKSIVLLLDSDLRGGSPSHSAIENRYGTLYARDVVTSGYRSAIQTGSTVIPGDTISEYSSSKICASSASTSLNLPIQETPKVSYGSLRDWVSVTQYGANGDDEQDDTAAIQRAIASGKPTVYFPRGNYIISQTLYVGSSVKTITGLYSILTIANPLQNSSQPVFRFEQNAKDTVTLEQFFGNYGQGSFHWVEHASAGTVVLRNFILGSGKAYRNTQFGRLFIEDVSAGDWVFDRQSVWIRQINPENTTTKIINRGGTVWILGLKTEKEGTALETLNGGKTEVLGGLIYPAGGGNRIPPDQPAFINRDSQLSLAAIGESNHSVGSYNIVIQEIRGGITNTLFNAALPRRGRGFLIPLYSSGCL
jgi:Pectate lyase superfamily protein